MTYALLAFDLDGTLADTEGLSLPDLIDFLNTAYNVPITQERFYEAYHGMTGQALLDKLNAEFGCHLEWAEFLPRRTARLKTTFDAGIPAAAGVFQALKLAAAAGYPMCVCSNSTPDRMRYSLSKVSGQHSAGVFLEDLFDGHMFSATDPAQHHKPKPAPDVYLAAAEASQKPPATCLAVEDSPTGITAAVTAGYGCVVGYTGTSHNPKSAAETLKAAGAHVIMHHWDDFFPLLQAPKA
jgi:beta-phosphoglucomutase-like phosphatase (HAD superfamily)